MSDTREVEKSISSIAMLPFFVSNHFEKGSVVKRRKPRDVPDLVSGSSSQWFIGLTDSQLAVVLVKCDIVHCHACLSSPEFSICLEATRMKRTKMNRANKCAGSNLDKNPRFTGFLSSVCHVVLVTLEMSVMFWVFLGNKTQHQSTVTKLLELNNISEARHRNSSTGLQAEQKRMRRVS